MNEAQSLLNQVAMEEAFKALTEKTPLKQEVEKLCRLMFSAGWMSHRKVSVVDKMLKDVR